ncbi:hypothetical protein [Rhodococcus opacus]|uniref:hypothetical protein n=1 Tax=Rhodococcus opacus TaxID=37919 RepID=UPI001C43AF9D|nr:hypothetical protein [Rhodococcus opacus]MBV6758420.1 hypothetical protein [Rhodococcus opacus]
MHAQRNTPVLASANTDEALQALDAALGGRSHYLIERRSIGTFVVTAMIDGHSAHGDATNHRRSDDPRPFHSFESRGATIAEAALAVAEFVAADVLVDDVQVAA